MSRITELNMNRSTSESTGASYTPKRSKATIVVVVLVTALLGLFAYVGKDHFLPALPVEVARAQAVKSTDTSIPEGELAFQSAGWLEPAPFPVRASALVSGVVKKVHVLEGATVKKGDIIAELIDQDIHLDIAENNALLKKSEQQLLEIKAELEVAVAKSQLHKAAIETARRTCEKLRELSETLEDSGPAISKLDRLKAKHNVAIQKAAVDEAVVQAKVLANSEEVVKAKIAAQEAALELTRNTNAKLQLALKRTKVYSPIDGVVMRLNALNGSVLNLDSDSNDAAVVADLYDPEMLQVKVDVPLSDAAGLSIGQKATVKVELLPEKIFNGVVTSIAGQADINRNTLQAKVRISAPDPKLRPEMLAKVKFLSIGGERVDQAEQSEVVRVFIPQSAVSRDGSVWVVDRVSQKAQEISVSLGRAKKDGWVEVAAGVNAGQFVITSKLDKLESEMRVEPQTEE